ncbi:hypothetical protein FAZ19_15650 [Sphingobacterium alkalisoli]|uniref:Uncharacterized protein n=1 Tax=Sphingobacterium alkalisoli TaxID=1874115 RepID=A0A4V5LXS6_9SPHI|nr:DUF4795 domain-containing protein [Sphingobacterium alkalisoli]TJY63709.1 hypothetical protein FAZ19_15650 [Sphingobacterium alkalisoli]GGH25398.1 hypothetical protein GCM10011418_33980 [Sphingobacterium alkalisoli]
MIKQSLIIILLQFSFFLGYSQHQGASRIGQTTYTPDDESFGSITVSYTYAFNGTQFKIKVDQVIIGISNKMQQNEPALVNELRKRDILPHTQQNGKGLDMRYDGNVAFFDSGYPDKLPLTPSTIDISGNGYTYFEPTEALGEIARIYRNNNKGSSFYNKHADLSGNLHIISFDYPSLRREIEAIRVELKNKAKADKTVADSDDTKNVQNANTESITDRKSRAQELTEEIQDKLRKGDSAGARKAKEELDALQSEKERRVTTNNERDAKDEEPQQETFNDIMRRIQEDEREIVRKAETGRAAVNATADVMSGLAQQDGDKELVYQYIAADDIALTTNNALFGFRTEGRLHGGFDFGIGQGSFSTVQEGEIIEDSGYGFIIGLPIAYRFPFSSDLKTTEGSAFLGIMGNGGMYFGSTVQPAGFFSYGGYAGINFMHFTIQGGYGTLHDLTGDLLNYSHEGLANGGSSPMYFFRIGFTW